MSPLQVGPAAECDVAAALTVLQRVAELSDAGAHEPALALLDRALATHGDAAELHTARGWALENVVPPRLAEAQEAYEVAIGLDAGQLWAKLGLATVRGQLGQVDACPPIYREAAEKARLRTAEEPEYLELLGWCQYRLGQLDDAATTFTAALAIDSEWVSVRFDLALVLLLLGDADEAGRHCQAGIAAIARRGPLKVALDDFDEALQRHPSIAAGAMREQLARALAEAS